MARDNRYESWLGGEGVDFRFIPQAPLDAFDVEGSLRNQARIVPLDPEKVEEMAYAMVAGVEFPAVIAWQGAKGYILISGNHRLAAAREAGLAGLDVYLVQTADSYVIDRLTRTANGLEGDRTKRGEAILHAKELVRVHKMTVKDVATLLRLPESVIHKTIRAEETADRLARMGLSPAKAPSTTLERMSAVPTDRALVEVEKIRRKAALTGDEVGALVSAVRRERSEDGQVRAARLYAERPEIKERLAQAGSRPAVPIGPAARRRKLLSEIERFIDAHPSPAAMQLTAPSDIEHTADALRRINEKLRRILRDAHAATAPAHPAMPNGPDRGLAVGAVGR